MADIHVTSTGYPNSLDTATTLSNDTVAGDGSGSAINAAHQNGPAGAIIAIETALGTLPQGTATDVKTRLAVGMSGTGQLLLGTASALAAALLASKGGTGIDTSASTGIPSISAGTWSVLAKVTAALGGTGIDTSASSGLPMVAAGVWSVSTTQTPQVSAIGVGTAAGSANTVKLAGATSGTSVVQAQAVAGTTTFTLPTTTGTLVGSGDSGTVTGTMIAAATIAQANMASASIGTGQLKTSTASASVNLGAGINSDVTMNDYAFESNKNLASGTSSNLVQVVIADTSTTSTVATFRYYNPGTTTSMCNTYWRYITASANPDLHVIADITGEIISAWVSEDPLPVGATPLRYHGGPHAVQVAFPDDLDGINKTLPAHEEHDPSPVIEDAHVPKHKRKVIYTVDQVLIDRHTAHPELATQPLRAKRLERFWKLHALARSNGRVAAEEVLRRYRLVNGALVLKPGII